MDAVRSGGFLADEGAAAAADFAVFFGFVGVDSNDEVTFGVEGFGEVGDAVGLVFATEVNLVFWDLAAAGGGGNFLDEMGDADGVFFSGEGGFEDVAMAVADKGEVLTLGIVEGNAEDFSGVSGTLKNGVDEGVLIAIDGLDLACWFVDGSVKIPC